MHGRMAKRYGRVADEANRYSGKRVASAGLEEKTIVEGR
jgi:hypothetical protein